MRRVTWSSVLMAVTSVNHKTFWGVVSITSAVLIALGGFAIATDKDATRNSQRIKTVEAEVDRARGDHNTIVRIDTQVTEIRSDIAEMKEMMKEQR